jgi:hypothetical protein
MEKENEILRDALEKIERWHGEFPETKFFVDAEKTRQMSYEAAYGSDGEREFMRGIARVALSNAFNQIPQTS